MIPVDFGLGPNARRAIDYLETLPAGAELSTSGLLDALPGAKLVPLLRELEAAVNAGHLFRRKRETLASAPWWWSLTDHGERRAPPPPVDLPPKPPVSTWSPAPFPPERRTLARAPTPVAQSAPAPAPVKPPKPAASSSSETSEAPGATEFDRRAPATRGNAPSEAAPTGQADRPGFAPPTPNEGGRTGTQPSRRKAQRGLNGDPGRMATAAAQAILSAPPAPNLSELQAATPSGDLRICMWHDGTLEVWDAGKRLAQFKPEQTLQLADYFGAITLAQEMRT